ncbi:MAG: energy-coupling factor transporter ATP-binding protein EcfA2 [Bermanella sp.]|jgi:energy-coupling factor transporter ATP-binding protein EcfA2
MKKIIISITRVLAKSLNSIASRLETKGSSDLKPNKFVDLAPIDTADDKGIYSEALLFATNKEEISNIALTGPYGSGKSSILKTFLKTYTRPSLYISLASFEVEVEVETKTEDEATNKKGIRQEIERSILQQIVYGADANKLPLSRFKRIQSPGFPLSILKSFCMMLGIIALWYVFDHREQVFNGSFLLPFSVTNWLNLGSVLIAGVFLWAALHHFYVASFGLSLKSISLKDIEIKPANDDQASILNRHLDEIIYFFQSTKYDLVIIEDLDRFNDPEIFVTLREINNLVNENAGVNRTIRFLYAIRDDMFANTERTKFFEFIIPVIPIINTSNSIDMVLKQGVRLELDERLDGQFLREVSRYLNDLRLIRNIFNEYAIYEAKLEVDGERMLDPDKLLAILIYKNFYPRDFEQLHRGVGVLFKILNIKDELIAPSELVYREKIEELEKQLEIAEQQVPSDLVELKKIYSMNLIEKLRPDTIQVCYQQGNWVPLKELVNDDAFEELIGATNLIQKNAYNHQNNINLSHLKSETDPQKTYKQRKAEIESNSEDNKSKILRHIRDLRSKVEALRMKKLNEILRLNIDSMADVFKTLEENSELARFLVLEGHIDDTYYQYTSLFHSGRLSPRDNKFLIQIRAFITPEPDFQIDNPKEVIAAMRDEDFGQSYALNVKLVDSLLNESGHYSNQVKKLFEFISSNFKKTEGFFDAYYASGCDVKGLLSGLSNTWNGLVPAIIASHNNSIHIARLISSLPEDSLRKLGADFKELSGFISKNLPEILVNVPELEPIRLSCINVKVKNFSEVNDYSEIVHFMFEEGHYELTIPNLEYVYQVILREHDLESFYKKNFTTLRNMDNEALKNRVEHEFSFYFHNILLKLQDNSEEDASTILEVIWHEEIEQDYLYIFLEQQTTRLPLLEDTPDRMHSMLFDLIAIEPTWENCLALIEDEEFEADNLIRYLEEEDVREIILKSPIPSDSESFKLREFIINAGAISDTVYREYVQALPRPFKVFPKGLEESKLHILIDERKVVFSQESLGDLSDNYDLQVLFVATNIDIYLAEPGSFELDDDFFESLLNSEISHNDQLEIIKLMNLDLLVKHPGRAALVGPIIQNSDADEFDLNADILRALIDYSIDIETKVSLLNAYNVLLDDDEVRQLLSNLPHPFSEIKTGHTKPKLKNTPENRNLVSWLDSRKIISSWKKVGHLSSEIQVNLYRA